MLHFDAPDLDVENIPFFLPEDYEDVPSIEGAIGSSFVSENERLMTTFRQLKKLFMHQRLTIAHLVELDKELRFHDFQEERLYEDLEIRGLQKLAARLMQLMAEKTGLTEGFMPVTPLDDRITKRMRRQIENRLKI